MRHELIGDFLRQHWIESSSDVDRCQFAAFARIVRLEFFALAIEVGLFGIRLRVDRHILARGHRHGAGYQPGDSRHHDVAMCRMCGGNT